MGGYLLPDGRKLQADDYITHLETENERLHAAIRDLRERAESSGPSYLRGFIMGRTGRWRGAV